MNSNSFDDCIAHVDTRHERARLIGLCALMLLAGVAFAGSAGPPRLPPGLPSLQDVESTLSGSSLPVAPLVLVVVDLAWLMWIWIVGSLLLELVLAVAELTAEGATWVRSLRGFADRVSVPLVRRVVAAAFAVQVLSRGVPLASAQTIAPAETALVAEAHAKSSDAAGPTDNAGEAPTYLVRDGDTLWSIAERAYGSGEMYPRVIEANLGRGMSDGQVFSARGVIQPGWQLAVPGALTSIDQLDGERWYTVRPGDSLTQIADSTLGDGTRWSQLFAANRGATTPDGRHSLLDPDVIWPSLRLRLPEVPIQADAIIKPTDVPEADSVELMVATAQPAEAEQPAAQAPDSAPQSEAPVESEPLPLLRTPHALDPVVLEPADSPAPAESDAASVATDAEAVAEPAAVADAGPTLPSTPVRPDLPIIPLAVGGLGVAIATGLAFGARRIRRLRRLPQEPESEVVVEGGFAEAQLAHDLTRGLHGVGFDPVAALVGQAEQLLAEYNLTNVAVIAVRHGRSSTTLTLQCALAEQVILVDLAPVIAERLDADVDATVSRDQDVLLCLTRVRRTRLLPIAGAAQPGPCLVPLGVLYDRQVHFAAWSSVGHVLAVSLPGHGADTILTSLVATLTARRSPEQLRIWLLASNRALPAPMFNLPHLARVVDPADEAEMSRATDELRTELEWRSTHQPTYDLVVVIPELAGLGEHAASFALLAERAAQLGVRIVAASTNPDDALASPLMSHFVTRMVLRMQAEEASVALLGVADAAYLPGGGRLFLRVDGREAVELYGYQVTPEHLERLVKLMRSAYAPVEPLLPPLDPADAWAHPAEPSESEAAAEPTPSSITPDDEPSAPTPVFEPQPSVSVAQSPTPAEATELSPPVNTLQPAAKLARRRRDSTTAECKVSQAEVEARPPIEVMCFGSPRVLCRGRELWPQVRGGDAKPWEFLLYVACQPVEGVSRYRLFQSLWPDDESPEVAAHRFRQLRYRLRRALLRVPGAPRSDGVCVDQVKLRLDPGIVYSDAQEFLRLVRSARANPEADQIRQLERARELYVADILDGPDARRYAWIDERDESGVTLREHFRRQFHQASLRLAELHADVGATDASIAIYRELAEIDPSDDRLWRALFRLHAGRGDRQGLLREKRSMHERLREMAEDSDSTDGIQLDEPSPEAVSEFQRLLTSLEGRDREPATA